MLGRHHEQELGLLLWVSKHEGQLGDHIGPADLGGQGLLLVIQAHGEGEPR